MTRDTDGPGLRLPGPSEDTRAATGGSAVIVGHPGRFGQPSSYSLAHAELAAHIRGLRRSGWQSWEIRARFDFGGCRYAA